MSKKYIDEIMHRCQVTRGFAEELLSAICDIAEEEIVKEGTFKLKGIGKFYIKEVNNKNIKDMNTGKPLGYIPLMVKFKCSPLLASKINDLSTRNRLKKELKIV